MATPKEYATRLLIEFYTGGEAAIRVPTKPVAMKLSVEAVFPESADNTPITLVALGDNGKRLEQALGAGWSESDFIKAGRRLIKDFKAANQEEPKPQV
jgi:hypothetical protein